MLHFTARRARRARTTIVGLLTALAWVWSVVQLPVPPRGDHRELERGTAYAAPTGAANAPALRSLHGATRHHGAGHVLTGGVAATSKWALAAAPNSQLLGTNRLVPVPRYRVSPYDATAPPVGDTIA